VQKAIGRHAFFEWLILETLQELLDETGDAVSQIEIARRAGLSKTKASHWMFWMEEHGLIDRGPSSDGRAYRIWLGGRGEELLRICNERLEAAGIHDP
jgi:DNA-binding MarR family transcriptional regulator